MDLKEFFEKYPEVAIAFSGGVDSSYLLYAAKQYAKRCTAYYVKSDFQPEFEYRDAKRLAEEYGLSPSGVRAALSRARNILREKLKE